MIANCFFLPPSLLFADIGDKNEQHASTGHQANALPPRRPGCQALSRRSAQVALAHLRSSQRRWGPKTFIETSSLQNKYLKGRTYKTKTDCVVYNTSGNIVHRNNTSPTMQAGMLLGENRCTSCTTMDITRQQLGTSGVLWIKSCPL